MAMPPLCTTNGGGFEPGLSADHHEACLAIIQAEKDGMMGLCRAADALEDRFKAMGLMFPDKMIIHCRQIAFDLSNREKMLGFVEEVFLLQEDIAFLGWCWQVCSHATCCEVKPGDSEVEDANRLFVEGTGLAPIEEDSIRYGSLSAGHTNAGLRCINAEVPSDSPLLSQDGRMSKEKLRKQCPEHYKAVNEGMPWKVLRWPVREKYPEALGLIARARNTAGHVARKVNEVEGLAQMHSAASGQIKAAAASGQKGATVDWVRIKRAVLRSRPPYVDRIDALILFVAAKGGGVEGHYLKFCKTMHRRLVNPSKRVVLGPLFAALADFPYQYLSYAILIAAYTCPEEHLRAGVCSWISATEVTSLWRNTNVKVVEKLRDAEKTLVDAFANVGAIGCGSDVSLNSKLTTVFSKLFILLARFVLNKQTAVVFDDTVSIANVSLKEFAEAVPQARLEEYHRLWPAPLAKLASPVGAAGIELYEINSAGDVVHPLALIRRMGLDVGACVGQGDSDDLFRITGCSGSGPTDGKVHLQAWAEEKTAASSQTEEKTAASSQAEASPAKAAVPSQTEASPAQAAASSQTEAFSADLVPAGPESAKEVSPAVRGSTTEVGILDFSQAWKRKDQRRLVEKHIGFPQHHTTGTKAWKQLQAKAAIVSACGSLAGMVGTPWMSVSWHWIRPILPPCSPFPARSPPSLLLPLPSPSPPSPLSPLKCEAGSMAGEIGYHEGAAVDKTTNLALGTQTL